MDIARLLGMFSLVAFLGAVAVVVSGQTTQIESLISPASGGSHARSQAFANSPIGKAQAASADDNNQNLIQAAIYDSVGTDTIDQAALFTSLKAGEPEAKLGQPLAAGGTDMHVYQKRIVVFCSKPTLYYVCSGLDMRTRAKASHLDSTENLAYNNVLQQLGAKQSASSTEGNAVPATGGSLDDAGAGTGLNAIQKAEQIQSQVGGK